ncbi:MAG: ATPase domain-containing protein, partial [Candidatus Bathyarchaeia archaeon]
MSGDLLKTSLRVKTGIPGLDELVEGGFIPSSAILLRGGSGAGKTIFGLQFLHYGALREEPGVLLSLEETADELRREAARFGWDLEEQEKRGMLKIIEAKPWTESFKHTLAVERLENTAREVDARRVVVDSIPALFQMYLKEATPNEGARALGQLAWKLTQGLHATALFITRVNGNGNSTIEEDVCRGVIELRLRLVQGVVKRYLLVK